MTRSAGKLRQVQGFFQDYTAGLKAKDLRRLFNQEASQAYAALSSGQELGHEPRTKLRRLLYRTRIIFLGLSYKLTPARRLLFAGSLVFALLGLFEIQSVVSGDRFTIDFSPFWFVCSIGALLFLFTLELVDRVRVRDELEVARQLQSDLLPSAAPRLAGYRFAHSYRTANEIGGDYYGFTELAGGRLALTVGDASGHGMAAGLLMATAHATLRAALDVDPAPEKVLTLLNRALCRTGNKRAFMSLFYALLEIESGRMAYLCAGHPFPLLRRAAGEIVELGRGGLPLGIRQPLEWAPESVVLAAGDLLVLYSDGLAEAVGSSGEAFGYHRLKQLLHDRGDPQTVHDRILRAFEDHLGAEPLADDLSLVVLAKL